MSARHYLNCEICGQPYTVEENAHNVTFTVGGNVVTECPVCGGELTVQQQPKEEVE